MGTDIRIALMLFTVLAPAGAIAFAFMSARIVSLPARSAAALRLERCLAVPIASCMVGLIASATHLGTPGNALYVLTGAGRSPLSNEVLAAVAFLSLAWLFWLTTFTKGMPPAAKKIWLAAASVAAFWLVSRISVVYSIPTIPTWDSPYVPASLWSTALTTSPLLCCASFALAKDDTPKACVWLLFAVGLLSSLASVAVLAMQGAELAGIRDSYRTADALVPYYGACIAAFGALALSGYGANVACLLKSRRLSAVPTCIGLALAVFAAIVVRVPFYAMHMTVGM